MVNYIQLATLFCFSIPLIASQGSEDDKSGSMLPLLQLKWHKMDLHRPEWLTYLQIALLEAKRPHIDVIAIKKVLSADESSGKHYLIYFMVKSEALSPNCKIKFSIPFGTSVRQMKYKGMDCDFDKGEEEGEEPLAPMAAKIQIPEMVLPGPTGNQKAFKVTFEGTVRLVPINSNPPASNPVPQIGSESE